MKNRGLVTLLLAALVTLCTPVQAVTVSGQMHGYIAEYVVTSGLGSSVFGLDGSAMQLPCFTSTWISSLVVATDDRRNFLIKS